jgi:hypothetical protein
MRLGVPVRVLGVRPAALLQTIGRCWDEGTKHI